MAEAPQIFGYTPPEPAPVGKLVKFVQAFLLEDDASVRIVTRNEDGAHCDVVLPMAEAQKLADALICSVP